jgi:hypothetical protein
MRRSGVSAILMLAILALTGLAWAATASFTPPAQSGNIFAVVNYERASGANRTTSITVTWGQASRTETVVHPYGNCASATPAGFVLLVRNGGNTSPFGIATNGTIVRGPYQGEPPPEISHTCYKFVKMRFR